MARVAWVVGLAASMSLLGLPALAADLVVVKAEGVSLRTGDLIPGSQPLKLDAGQKVSLIAPSGKTIRLTGPHDLPPLPDAALEDPTVIGSLKAMVKERSANTASLGITRVSGIELPEPWVVDVGSSGNRCVMEGARPALWRPDGKDETSVALVAREGKWRAKATWPAGHQKLTAPDAYVPSDGDTLVIQFPMGKSDLAIHLGSASLANDAMRLAWLLEVGCDAQAAALSRLIK